MYASCILRADVSSELFGCRACYGVLRFIMESGAKGCEVIVSGKLRAQRAKAMKFKDGYMIASGHPAVEYIDGCVRHVMLRQGVLGIKVGGMLLKHAQRFCAVKSLLCHVCNAQCHCSRHHASSLPLHLHSALLGLYQKICLHSTVCFRLPCHLSCSGQCVHDRVSSIHHVCRQPCIHVVHIDAGAHHERLGPKRQAGTQDSSA